MPIPLLAAGQAVLGLGQAIGGAIQARRATKALERLQSPTYTANKSILDFYNESLKKYKVNPYQTDLYRMQQQQADRSLASGLSALGGRGQALAGVNNLVQSRNDSLLKAGAMAEQQQGQDLNRLGQASQLKAGEERTAFDINQQQPFERKYNLLAMKAGAGNQKIDSGISNIFGAGQTASQMGMIDKLYGDSGGGSSYSRSSPMTNMSVYRELLQNRNRRVG